MNTTANNRLEEILNETPNTKGAKPKPKQQSPQNLGQNAGEIKFEELTEINRKIADQITERNALASSRLRRPRLHRWHLRSKNPQRNQRPTPKPSKNRRRLPGIALLMRVVTKKQS